jgi:glycosyltransferase involved in cell wall biosynthesis
MASGLPLLLADALALTELITPGGNGYLFRPGNPADALRCIQLISSQRERWKEMGRISLEKARSHSLQAAIERYAALYVQILESSSALESVAKPRLRNRGAEIAHRSGHP